MGDDDRRVVCERYHSIEEKYAVVAGSRRTNPPIPRVDSYSDVLTITGFYSHSYSPDAGGWSFANLSRATRFVQQAPDMAARELLAELSPEVLLCEG